MCIIMTTKDNFSKYAVIRLKNSDNLLGLFQLLLHNGYSQVSFVNSLNETIFPSNDRLEKSTQTFANGHHNHLNGVGVSSRPQQTATSSVSPFDRKPTTMGLDLMNHNLSPFGPLTSLPTIPSGFLGLPTLPSLLAHHHTVVSNGHMFHSNALSEATTPPYAIMNGVHNQQRATMNCLSKPTKQQISQPPPLEHRPPQVNNSTGVDQERSGSNHHRPCQNSDPLPTITSSVPTATNTQLRQRGQRSYTDDPSLYVTCRLCKNRIMGSRISNLTNHVRRHSTLKQFQCCYCDYTHNEMAKVRLHMLHNHKDKDSQPIDNLSPEMQIAWEQLMKECFPEHCQNGSANGTTSTATSRNSSKVWKNGVDGSGDCYENGECDSGVIMYDGSSAESTTSDVKEDKEEETSSIPLTSSSPDYQQRNGELESSFVDCGVVNETNGQKSVQCIECNQFVNIKNRARHIRSCHLQCLPFLCSMCGYDHAEHCKVKLHIVLKHDDDPAAHVLTRDVGQMMEQLVPRYFPDSPSSEMSPPANVNDGVMISPVLLAANENNNDDDDDDHNHLPSKLVADEKTNFERAADTLGIDLQCFLAPSFEPLKQNLSSLMSEPVWPKDLTTAFVSHAIKRRYSSSKRHMVTPYQCPKCSYSSSSYRRMTNHVALRHTVDSECLQYAK